MRLFINACLSASRNCSTTVGDVCRNLSYFQVKYPSYRQYTGYLCKFTPSRFRSSSIVKLLSDANCTQPGSGL
jgi:hypothetical protein